MIHALKPITPKPSEIDRCPALLNPAVARCVRVWQRVQRSQLKETHSIPVARVRAHSAYLQAMPPLDSYQNILDYIACVGYAMTNAFILEETGASFLNAARIALNAISPRMKPRQASSDDPKP